jgi:nucleoside-diphosphate-sugar epimerase
MRVLVTGAGGFVGRAAVAKLLHCGTIDVRAASRAPRAAGGRLEWVDSSGFGPSFNWRSALEGVDTVVHLAGRAHVLKETSRDPEREFFAMNSDATRRLAEQSVDAGVRRFVLASTIGVHGDASPPGRPLTESHPIRPYDAYTRSKAAGEQAAVEAARRSTMAVTILRPAMVYGANAPGNFGRLVSLVRSGVPLPFGSIRNSRSFISIDNLVSVIRSCIDIRPAAVQAFVLADGEDLSTPTLVREIAAGSGMRASLIPMNERVLEAGLWAIGKGTLARRLIGSLQVDASLARGALGWKPIVDARTAIRRAAHETGD